MKSQPPATPADITPVTEDSWTALRRHTDARIALGRSGASLPTREVLRFGIAQRWVGNFKRNLMLQEQMYLSVDMARKKKGP